MTPALPPTPPAVVRFVDAVANVRHDEPRGYRISDINALADMLPSDLPWIASGAEIDNRVSRVAWTSLLGGTHFGLATETPIALSADWTLIGTRIHVATNGIPGIDPARKTVVAKVRNDATGIKVAIIAEHKDHLAFGPNQVAASRRGWFRQFYETRALALRLRLLGYVVVINEDGNHAAGPIHYGRGQITAACSGLMQISVLPPIGSSVHASAGHVTKAWTAQGIHTDHPILTVPITITKG
jgi:hypothetical protein